MLFKWIENTFNNYIQIIHRSRVCSKNYDKFEFWNPDQRWDNHITFNYLPKNITLLIDRLPKNITLLIDRLPKNITLLIDRLPKNITLLIYRDIFEWLTWI